MAATVFAVIDFETATSSRASACAVAVAAPQGNGPPIARSWLVRPPRNSYAPRNTAIHGICARHTAAAPQLSDLWPEVEALIRGRLVIAHNMAFDRDVLARSLAKCSPPIQEPKLHWACSLAMARHVWPRWPTHKLGALCERLDIELEAHNPESDAQAVVSLVDHMTKITGLDAGTLASREWSPVASRRPSR